MEAGADVLLTSAMRLQIMVLVAGAVLGWIGWSLSGIARGQPPLPTFGNGLVLVLAGLGFWWLFQYIPLRARRPFDARLLSHLGRVEDVEPPARRARVLTHPVLAAIAVAVGVTLWDWRSGGAPYAVMFVGWLAAAALRQYQRLIRVDDEEAQTGLLYVLRPDVWLSPWP